MNRIVLIFLLLTVTAYADPDLTPSVRYFAFDYETYAMSEAQDSILAGRYDALVADNSYGSGYRDRYNLFYAHKPDFEFYVYLNFNDAGASSAGQGYVNEVVGALMVADGQDSNSMYWHSLDTTYCSGAPDLLPHSVSEMGSRVTTYEGGRNLINNTNLNFIKHFATYANGIDTLYSATKNYELAGLWFDNMGTPSTCDRTAADQGSPQGCMWENTLDSTLQFGGEGNLTWQQNYADTVLIKYTGIVAESLEARSGLKVNMNALGHGNSWLSNYAYGWNMKELSPDLVAPANREFEFGGNIYVNRQFFYPGPTDGATSIDIATVEAYYSPRTFSDSMASCGKQGVENWFNPAEGSATYGFTKRWMDFLAAYYLWRGSCTFVGFANTTGCVALNALNWAEPIAGVADDSSYWIDALGTRVGRADDTTAWDYDTVFYYAASVKCDSCLLDTAGVGKDDDGNNWVAFMKRWAGDDSYNYMVISRPTHYYAPVGVTTYAPSFSLGGTWDKLLVGGTWDAGYTIDSLRSGEGFIYRQTASEEASISQSVSAVDTNNTDIRFRVDFTLNNGAYVDILKMYISADTFSTLLDSVIIPDASDPQDSAFSGLTRDVNYQFKSVAIDEDSSISDTSSILYITTLDEDTTIAQVLTEVDTDSISIDVSNDYTLDNTVIDTSVFYISVDTSTTLDSAIYVSPADPRTHTFEGLDYSTNYQTWVISWDESAGVTDTSNILHSVTDAGPSPPESNYLYLPIRRTP